MGSVTCGSFAEHHPEIGVEIDLSPIAMTFGQRKHSSSNVSFERNLRMGEVESEDIATVNFDLIRLSSHICDYIACSFPESPEDKLFCCIDNSRRHAPTKTAGLPSVVR